MSFAGAFYSQGWKEALWARFYARAAAYQWTWLAICSVAVDGREGGMDSPPKYFSELRDPRVEREPGTLCWKRFF
jgi:hypothetical protein